MEDLVGIVITGAILLWLYSMLLGTVKGVQRSAKGLAADGVKLAVEKAFERAGNAVDGYTSASFACMSGSHDQEDDGEGFMQCKVSGCTWKRRIRD